jgi:hypothetical protein
MTYFEAFSRAVDMANPARLKGPEGHLKGSRYESERRSKALSVGTAQL